MNCMNCMMIACVMLISCLTPSPVFLGRNQRSWVKLILAMPRFRKRLFLKLLPKWTRTQTPYINIRNKYNGTRIQRWTRQWRRTARCLTTGCAAARCCTSYRGGDLALFFKIVASLFRCHLLFQGIHVLGKPTGKGCCRFPSVDKTMVSSLLKINCLFVGKTPLGGGVKTQERLPTSTSPACLI